MVGAIAAIGAGQYGVHYLYHGETKKVTRDDMGRVAGVERQEYCVAEAGKRKCRCGCAPLSVKSYYAFV